MMPMIVDRCWIDVLDKQVRNHILVPLSSRCLQQYTTLTHVRQSLALVGGKIRAVSDDHERGFRNSCREWITSSLVG